MQAHVRLNPLLSLSRFCFRDMHASGRRLLHTRSNSTAASVMHMVSDLAAGSEEAGVPAGAEGGAATLEKSEPAVQERDAPRALELLMTLIAGEESSQKRQQLGHAVQGLLKEERSVTASLSSLRQEIELLRKKKKRRVPNEDGYGTDHGHVADDGYGTNDGGNGTTGDGTAAEEDHGPVSMKSRGADDLKDATQLYRDTVFIRNAWEAYVQSGSYERPLLYHGDLSRWTSPKHMLDEFEAAEIPEIKSGRTSRRKGWKKFLLESPRLRLGLEHHAGCGPNVEKQVDEVLDLWLVAHEQWSPFYKRHDKSYEGRAKSDRHFNPGPLSGQQVSALQCLGEYRRLLYVAVRSDGDSSLGRAEDPCRCAYCLAAGPNRSLVSQWEL